MRFKKTIYITPEIHEKICSGKMTVQKGQWVQLKGESHKSRYCGILTRPLWTTMIFHYYPTNISTLRRLCKS